MKKLDIISITQNSYKLVFKHFEAHAFLSYIFILPLMFIGYASGLTTGELTDPETNRIIEGAGIAVFLSLSSIMFLIMLFTIFLFRLYSLGRQKFLKLSFKKTFKILGWSSAYYILFFLVLILAEITAIMLMMTIVDIISANLGSEILKDLLIIFVFLGGIILFAFISCKLNLTFISIARGEKIIIFKNSWYYTTGHIRSIMTIYFFTMIIPYIITIITKILISNSFPDQDFTISILMIPIMTFSISLSCSAGSLIYKEISKNFINELKS